jgi:hypothetical protein
MNSINVRDLIIKERMIADMRRHESQVLKAVSEKLSAVPSWTLMDLQDVLREMLARAIVASHGTGGAR